MLETAFEGSSQELLVSFIDVSFHIDEANANANECIDEVNSISSIQQLPVLSVHG
jgi:hypothetical protein